MQPVLYPGDCADSPMRLALLSDIHANIEALQACLAHARDNGAAKYVFLGDYVGYGADVHAVVTLIERFAADGAVLVKGNHDEAIEHDAGYMNDSAKAAIAWARTALSDAQRKFLADLPLVVRDDDMCFVHASANAPQRWNYVDSAHAANASATSAGTQYTFSGHVHAQELYFQTSPTAMRTFAPPLGRPIPMFGQRRWLALVGSVGQPRDGNPAAAYCLFDRQSRMLTFYRVPYDHLAAAARIRRAGLPESLAHRLEVGA